MIKVFNQSNHHHKNCNHYNYDHSFNNQNHENNDNHHKLKNNLSAPARIILSDQYRCGIRTNGHLNLNEDVHFRLFSIRMSPIECELFL